MLLSVEHVAKAFGPSTVLEEVSFVLNAGERVGLVGANGSGKTTLLRIVAGEIEAEAGGVRFGCGVEVGYLPQEVPELGTSVDELIDRSMGELQAMERRLRWLEQEMGRRGEAGEPAQRRSAPQAPARPADRHSSEPPPARRADQPPEL